MMMMNDAVKMYNPCKRVMMSPLAERLPIRRKTLSNQSINLSKMLAILTLFEVTKKAFIVYIYIFKMILNFYTSNIHYISIIIDPFVAINFVLFDCMIV